jgi:hypothetical protein
MSGRLALLHSGLLLVVFLVILNDRVGGDAAQITEVVLAGLWLGLVTIAFAGWGWVAGVAALLLSVGYAAATAQIARGTAQRLKGMHRRRRLRL